MSAQSSSPVESKPRQPEQEATPSVPFEILTDPNMKILPRESGDMMSLPTAQKGTIGDHDPEGCMDPTHNHGLDLPDPEEFWTGNMKKMLPMPALAALTADELFGTKMDLAKPGSAESKDENLFLNALLDETQPLQSELIAKINATFDANGFHPPDRISLQVFRRKAGFAQKPGDADMGRFTVAICLRDFQVVSFDRKEDIVTNGNLSPFYELEPHPTDEEGKGAPKKKQFSPRPGVPKNRTTIKLPNGKALLKSRQYLCIMAWAFWVDDPVKREEPRGPIGIEKLQKMVDEMKARGETEQAAELEKIIAEAKDPKPDGDGLPIPLYDAATEVSRLGAKMTDEELKDFKNPMVAAGMIREPTQAELQREHQEAMASPDGRVIGIDRFHPMETPEGEKVGMKKEIDLEALQKLAEKK